MMASATFALLERAINNKLIVVAEYQGYYREMCPHTLGYKDGREKCLFYQFAGQSKSGIGPPGSFRNWRCVFVDELQNVSVRQGSWSTASDHSRRQTCVDDVVVAVKF